MMLGMGLSMSAGGGVKSFSPSQLSNLTWWLRGDLGVVGGGTPTAWNDQSTAGNNLTTGAGTLSLLATGAPNSLPAVRFGAATSSLSGVGRPFNGNAYTLWIVQRITGGPLGSQNTVVLGSTTKVALGLNSGASRLMTIGANTQNDSPSTYTSATWEAWGYIVSSGGTQVFQVNGSGHTLSGNIAAGTPDAGIALQNTAAAVTSVDVAEVIGMNATAAAGDITNVNAYLLARYGL
jgi:hypothetical protein